MPISKQCFNDWMDAFGERWYPLGGTGRAAYYTVLSPKFENDQVFEAVAVQVYQLDQPRMPAPAKFLEALAVMKSPVYQRPQLPESTGYTLPPEWLSQAMYLTRSFKDVKGWRVRFLGEGCYEIVRSDEPPVQIVWTGQGWECRDDEDDEARELIAQFLKKRQQDREARSSSVSSLRDCLTLSGF